MSASPNDHFRHLSCTQKFPLGKTSEDDWKPILNNSESTGTIILPVSNIKWVRFSIGISLNVPRNQVFIKKKRKELYSRVRGVELIMDGDWLDGEWINIKSPWPRLQEDGQLQNKQIGRFVEVIGDWN